MAIDGPAGGLDLESGGMLTRGVGRVALPLKQGWVLGDRTLKSTEKYKYTKYA